MAVRIMVIWYPEAIMPLREQFAQYEKHFLAISAVTRCRDSLGFLDLCWPPFDVEAEMQRSIEGRDPGVIFETLTRVVVIEEHSGELRYYAGGWCLNQSRSYLEQDRIEAEGFEMGGFESPREAVVFVERFLAREEAFQDIDTPRAVHCARPTNKSRQ
jgi:hypothetical protein